MPGLFIFQPQITIKQVESKEKPKSNKRFTPSKDEAHKIVVGSTIYSKRGNLC